MLEDHSWPRSAKTAAIVSCFAGLLGVAACTTGDSRPASAPSSMMGKSLLLTMTSDQGQLVTLKPGKHLVLDFWSPSCEPCKRSVPEIVHREKEIAAKGAELLLVAVLGENEEVDAAKATLKGWGVERGFLVARDSSAAREAGVVGLPATYVLDSSGNLAWSAPKSATVSDVIAAIQ
jgi:hypothetical protein